MLPTDKYDNDYVPTYLELAARIGIAGRVCEIGVERGGSLELWRTLFPYGIVVGVDKDPNAVWPEGTHRVIADQTSTVLPHNLRQILYDEARWDEPLYDLIIDDASHIGTRTMATFLNLFPLVAPGRWYVIEDWGVGYVGQAPMYEPGMVDAAQSFVNMCAEGTWDVGEVRYRSGMIIIQRKLQ
jgi:cephalosporin hydroxylase